MRLRQVTDAAISVLGSDRVGFRVSPIYADVTEDRASLMSWAPTGPWPMPWPNGTCITSMWWKAAWSSVSQNSMPSHRWRGLDGEVVGGTWRGAAAGETPKRPMPRAVVMRSCLVSFVTNPDLGRRIQKTCPWRNQMSPPFMAGVLRDTPTTAVRRRVT